MHGNASAGIHKQNLYHYVNIDSTVLGIVVDSVQKVMDIDLNQVHPIPIKRRQKLLDGMVTVEDGRVLMSFDYKALASGQYN